MDPNFMLTIVEQNELNIRIKESHTSKNIKYWPDTLDFESFAFNCCVEYLQLQNIIIKNSCLVQTEVLKER